MLRMFIHIPSGHGIPLLLNIQKHWTSDSIARAYAAVKNNELSIKKAPEMYGIPYTYTRLSDRVKERSDLDPIVVHSVISEESELTC